MLRRAALGFFLILASAVAFTPIAAAQGNYAPGDYGAGVQPLDRILPAVRNGRAGRFFDAEGPFPDADGRYHYRIKWLTPQGRVIWLDTDARSGRVLGVARGDWREQGPPPVGFGERQGRFGNVPPPPPPRMGPGGGWRGRWHGRGR